MGEQCLTHHGCLVTSFRCSFFAIRFSATAYRNCPMINIIRVRKRIHWWCRVMFCATGQAECCGAYTKQQSLCKFAQEDGGELTCRTWQDDLGTVWATPPAVAWHSWACRRTPSRDAAAWSESPPPGEGSSRAAIERMCVGQSNVTKLNYSSSPCRPYRGEPCPGPTL